jgi:hypothetical protein
MGDALPLHHHRGVRLQFERGTVEQAAVADDQALAHGKTFGQEIEDTGLAFATART